MKIKPLSFVVMTIMITLVLATGCKKNTTYTPVGDWKLSNIQGKILTTAPPDTFVTTYDNSSKTKTEVDNGGAPDSYPYTLELNMQSSYALSVHETRTQGGTFDNTYTGTWAYVNGTSGVVLNGFVNTDFFGDFNSKTFVVNSVGSNTLVLTYNSALTPTGTAGSTSYTLTFTK